MSPSAGKRRQVFNLLCWIWSLNSFYFYIWTSPNWDLLIIKKSSWWFSLSLISSGAKPACGKGKRGNRARNDSNRHPISCTTRSIPYPLRERGRKVFFIPYNLGPTKTYQGREHGYSFTLRDGKGPFLFLKQKRLLILGFPKGGRKSLGEQERRQKEPKSYRRALGLAQGSFQFWNLIARQTPRTSV